MATQTAEVAAPALGARPRRRRGRALSSWGLLVPALVFLVLFFVAPLYYILMFSVGERQFATTEALARVRGEYTSFTLAIWRSFLEQGRTSLEVAGLSSSIRIPIGVLGTAAVVLVLLAVFAGRIPRVGGWVTAAAIFLLLAPFFTVPAGDNVFRLAKLDSTSAYLGLFFKSVSMSMTTSIFAVVLAFPIAYFLAHGMGRSFLGLARYTWLLVVIAPFFTSYLLRIVAWKVALGEQGLINTGLFSLGLRQQGDGVSWLIYSQFTVELVLLYAWIPFVCLPIFIALENLDPALHEAATDLGASRLQAFRRITLPLAAPGIVAAFLFVFIPTIGEFVTPLLVGGTKGYMFGANISELFGQATDWQTGSTLALFLLVVVLFLTALTSRFLRASGAARA